MDLSKVKVEVYDFLAVIIPGLFVIYEVWVALRGWARFAQGILSTSASGFTISLQRFTVFAAPFDMCCLLTIAKVIGRCCMIVAKYGSSYLSDFSCSRCLC